jgi:ribosomal protein L22
MCAGPLVEERTMNANASRSLADQGLDKNPGLASLDTWMSINRPMLEAMTEINGRLIEQVSRANNEWLGFVNRRMKEDMAASKRFMECRTVQDVFSAYSDFVQRAQQQYQAEFQYFARLNQKLADETATVLKSRMEEAEADLRH